MLYRTFRAIIKLQVFQIILHTCHYSLKNAFMLNDCSICSMGLFFYVTPVLFFFILPDCFIMIRSTTWNISIVNKILFTKWHGFTTIQLPKRNIFFEKTCSFRLVQYFGTLFWDDITIFWDENLLLFTFLTGKLRKKPVFDQQEVCVPVILTNFCPKIS